MRTLVFNHFRATPSVGDCRIQIVSHCHMEVVGVKFYIFPRCQVSSGKMTAGQKHSSSSNSLFCFILVGKRENFHLCTKS